MTMTSHGGERTTPIASATPAPAGDPAAHASQAPVPASAYGPLFDYAAAPPRHRGSVWTIPLLCLGLGTIAVVMLLPLLDENRRLTYEKQRLTLDLAAVQNQVNVNDEFIKRVADDPTLAERLAQRQMRYIREGSSVLKLQGDDDERQASPFVLLSVPRPAALAPYEPVAGRIAALCRDGQSQAVLTGLGLFLIAVGLVLGHNGKTAE